MAATIKSRGCVFKWTISSVLTAVPLIKSISKSGQGLKTSEIETLDGPVGVLHVPTGFANVAKLALKMFLDPANSVHQALKTASITPGAAACTLTYTDAGPVTETYSGIVQGFDEDIEGSKPVECTCNIQTSGLPT